MPAGRPSSYTLALAGVAERLCRNGATDVEIADVLGICVRTFYRWCGQHDAFAAALRAGKDLADDRVERALYQRAVGYTARAEKVVTRGQAAPVIVAYEVHIPADVRAALHWLAIRRPTPWARAAEVPPVEDIAAIIAERRAYVAAHLDEPDTVPAGEPMAGCGLPPVSKPDRLTRPPRHTSPSAATAPTGSVHVSFAEHLQRPPPARRVTFGAADQGLSSNGRPG